jgi:hypothetical protein
MAMEGITITVLSAGAQESQNLGLIGSMKVDVYSSHTQGHLLP